MFIHASASVTAMGRSLRLLVCALVFFAAAGGRAAPIEIAFEGNIALQGGGPAETVSGFFTLDSTVPFVVGQSFQSGVIVSGGFSRGGADFLVDPASPFTSVLAESGVIQLVGDYPLGLLSLTLDIGAFPSNDVYDVLNSDLSLDDLLPYVQDDLFSTNVFVSANGDFRYGELTAFSISQAVSVPEPTMLGLVLMGVAAGRRWVR